MNIERIVHVEGTWYITNRRLIHWNNVSSGSGINWKKTIVRGALFGGLGGATGVETTEPGIFDVRLEKLVSIDSVTGQPNVLKAVFRNDGNTGTFLIEVAEASQFKNEADNARRRFEEYKRESQRKKLEMNELMLADKTIQRLSSEIEALEEELRKLEDKTKDIDLAYAMGRISKDEYLEQIKKENSTVEIDVMRSRLGAKKKELEKNKRKYSE